MQVTAERRRLTVSEAQSIAAYLAERGADRYLLHYERGHASLTVMWRGSSHIIATVRGWDKFKDRHL